jgi:tRNA 5-methylaminomethyl-2-thiouridine biosynthesis bifunctional protein
MPESLVPARPAYAPDGTPYSERYQDVYHSAAGGPAQARHVFLAGNELPARWAGRDRFTVLETGFGIGLNFLATWQAWRADARRPARLHFVSVERHPFTLAGLRELHARYPEFAPLAAPLHARWPMLVPGVHRLELDEGRLVLTLAFGDAARALAELRLAADAIYLDGFAPERNPDMWTPEVMRTLARRAAPGATAATWSAAAEVRTALGAAGFEVQKRAGFATKREMLVARLARSSGAARDAAPPPSARRALVLGAGIAGAALCERLCARGWEVTLIERHHDFGAEASGNHAGIFHPVVTPDDSHFARLTRAGFLAALARWSALEALGAALRWDRCGVLQLARDAKEDGAQRAALAAARYPPEYAQYVTREEASGHAGVPLAAGGLWFPEAGWVQPRSLIAAHLDACGARLARKFGHEVRRLAREGGDWVLRERRGAEIARAPVVVLANASEAADLAPQPPTRLRRVRGQLTHLPAAAIEAPHAVVLRGGFVIPPVENLCVTGASFDLADPDASVRADSHAGNLERLGRILPGATVLLDPAQLEGRVAFRAVSPDRLPLAGALEPGLYGCFALGSRGLVWAPLGAELIASLIEGEPLPLEARLANALDPLRFARRAARRAGSQRAPA